MKNKIQNSIYICKICGKVPEQKLEKPNKPPIPIFFVCEKCKNKNSTNI